MDGGPPGNTWCRRLFIFAQESREKYNFFVLWAHLLGLRLPVWRTIGCQNRMEVVHRHVWNVRERPQYFLCCIKYPSPQPNIEIRKPNIELKVTLISVTICSLIFFICNLEELFEGRPGLRYFCPCGVLQRARHLYSCNIRLTYVSCNDYQFNSQPFAYDHTTMNTPVLV